MQILFKSTFVLHNWPRKLCVLPRERDRYPRNYFLIEQFVAQERGFQFTAQRNNAFVPRKRSRGTQPLFSTPRVSLPPRSFYLGARLPVSLSSRSSASRNASRATAQNHLFRFRGTRRFYEGVEKMRCNHFPNWPSPASCAFKKRM